MLVYAGKYRICLADSIGDDRKHGHRLLPKMFLFDAYYKTLLVAVKIMRHISNQLNGLSPMKHILKVSSLQTLTILAKHEKVDPLFCEFEISSHHSTQKWIAALIARTHTIDFYNQF
mmetsp:Transcript_1902/g.1867  ORF Transcript_1902/g.1867 Transcript_1902/m.1867 type:complete len:117 (-) Transcript_1902:7-357(-)